MILMHLYFENEGSERNFLSCFSSMPLSQLINKPPTAPTAVTQGQSGSPLTRPPSLQLIIWAHRRMPRDKRVSWLPVAPLKQEVALIQRDAACPWRLNDTISRQWYVAGTGNIADGNRVLGTASYLIHWPTSDARLVLIKWLGEIWLRKAVMPSDSSQVCGPQCPLDIG